MLVDACVRSLVLHTLAIDTAQHIELDTVRLMARQPVVVGLTFMVEGIEDLKRNRRGQIDAKWYSCSINGVPSNS